MKQSNGAFSMPNILFIFSLAFAFLNANGQRNAEYIRTHAVRVDNPEKLNDSVYNLISPFQILMIGEMHGTNEPAQFVIGLTNLLTDKGDSVSVGLEIPSVEMANFISSRTDSSIYQSNFFSNMPYQDGRESFAWARVISQLKNNRKVQLFFFDINTEEEKKYDRDNLMYLKIKKQIQLHPKWKMVTLSGNAHTMIPEEERKMAANLKHDKELNLSTKIAGFTNYFLQGSCHANFGSVLEKRTFTRPMNDFDTTFSFDKYVLLMSPKTTLPYTGMYYTKNITPAELTKGKIDIHVIKRELTSIFDRDQKVRKGDSAQFIAYVDSTNLITVAGLIEKYGWPGKSFVGNSGNYTIWLIIQHADLKTQEKYLPLMRASVDQGESRPVDFAYLEDRVLMRQNKKQIYGTQVSINKTTGAQELWPIEDEKNVNVRRKKLDLEPLEEYAKYFGIEYKLPN